MLPDKLNNSINSINSINLINLINLVTYKLIKLMKLTILTILMGLIIPVFAQDIPDKPKKQRLVNDFAGFLQPQEKQQLEQKLVQFAQQTSTQIAIVTVNDLKGYDVGDYAVRMAQKWGIGQKGKDNGILILIKPKTRESRGQVYIAPGYGLEGAVPDVIAKRIVENEIIPHFKQGQHYAGLNAAVNTLTELTRGEYTAEEYIKKTGAEASKPFPFFAIILLGVIIFSVVGKSSRARRKSVGHSIPFWLALTMLGGSGRRMGGSFNDFSSGSGSFGGGLGGFGGGSFGGGGAGGSW